MARKPHRSPKSAPQSSGNDGESQFDLSDFIQDAPTERSTSAAANASEFVQDADPRWTARSDASFTWLQDAIEHENEDVAAWGTTHESGEEFVWFQEARSPKPEPALEPSVAGETQRQKVAGAKGKPASENILAAAAAAAKAPSHFRPEIEGLRAVCVLMIVMYHVWLGRVSGGVDVFLFISAFLLGSSFARRLDSRTPFKPVAYWLRTFTRLMPPAIIAILGTLLGTWLLLPESAWQAVISQAIAAATYTQNMWLSYIAVDYYALDASTASPLQHFWSLSLQGQVFIVWPLIFIVTAFLARKSAHPRRIALGIFTAIALASFAYSIVFTAENQSAAYFSTPARAWEVALGTILALALPSLDRIFGAARPGTSAHPKHTHTRAAAGWAGFALLVSLGILIDVKGLFPGWIALWPLAGAGLIIIAGYSGSRWGFDRVLTLKAPRALASSSYSLYLVHWPILILWLAHSHKPRAGLADGFLVIAGSMLVAWALTKAVDTQFRSPVWKKAPVWRSLTVILVSLALVFAPTFGWRAYLDKQSAIAQHTAKVLSTGQYQVQPFSAENLTPKGYELGSQWDNLPYQCGDFANSPTVHQFQPCQTLLPMNATWDGLIIVVGSSHSREMIPTLVPIAKLNNWQIINYSMDLCPMRDDPTLAADDRCHDYYAYIKETIAKYKPNYVATTASMSSPVTNLDSVPAGTNEAIQQTLDAGVNVIAFRDPPRWEQNMYQCAEAVVRDGGNAQDAAEKCGAPLGQKLNESSPMPSLASMSGAAGTKVYTVDLSQQICPNSYCDPFDGNVYKYIDDNHLTKVYVSTLIPEVEMQLTEQGFPVRK